jgi:hypothetical protein
LNEYVNRYSDLAKCIEQEEKQKCKGWSVGEDVHYISVVMNEGGKEDASETDLFAGDDAVFGQVEMKEHVAAP